MKEIGNEVLILVTRISYVSSKSKYEDGKDIFSRIKKLDESFKIH